MSTHKFNCYRAEWAGGLGWGFMVFAQSRDKAEDIARRVIGLRSPYGKFMGELKLSLDERLWERLMELTSSPEALIQR